MKNLYKKLVIITSCALISWTHLYVMEQEPDTTFQAALTSATTQKTQLEEAIEAINNADMINGVLQEHENALTESYTALFTEKIKPQEDDTIQQILTLLYVAKIAGAAISRITTNMLSNTDFLHKPEVEKQQELKEQVDLILQAIEYKEEKYHDIEVKKAELNIEQMLSTPLQILAQVKKLILSLTAAKYEITTTYPTVKFSSMLKAKFGNTSIEDRLNKATENIDKLQDAYFNNIKSALIARGASIHEAKNLKVEHKELDTKKEGLAKLFHTVFEDDTTPTDQPTESDSKTDDNPPPPPSQPSPSDNQQPTPPLKNPKATPKKSPQLPSKFVQQRQKTFDKNTYREKVKSHIKNQKQKEQIIQSKIKR